MAIRASLLVMTQGDGKQGDSRLVYGGSIPDAPGTAAFTLSLPEPSTIPVLIAVPHAGRAYPHSLFERMRNPGFAAMRLEDRYVDKLAERISVATGAGLLVAQAPRAMIDLNRACDDVDWDMFARGAPPGAEAGKADSYAPGRRARSGLGLIPRRLPGIGELWKRRHDEADLADRITQIHDPYHACLSQALAALRERWGAALLIDLHSMPPLPRQAGQPPTDFVLGDRFGASCNGALVASTFAYFSGCGWTIAHNRPYAGGYVLDRHASPATGISAMQIEVDRLRYLDSRQSQPGEGFADIVHLVIGLVRRLAGEVAELGRMAKLDGAKLDDDGWAQAAE